MDETTELDGWMDEETDKKNRKIDGWMEKKIDRKNKNNSQK